MAWTEPGKNKKSEKQAAPEQKPPDLDKMLGDGWRKLTTFFGKKIPPYALQPATAGNPLAMFIASMVLAVIVWGLAGIFIVSPAEQAVILQFGRYKLTAEPGPHWIPRFIQSKTIVNIQGISTYPYQSQMLTKDQNIVDVSIAVQYRITDPKNYLFNIVAPVKSLEQVTASALRQVIGNANLDDVITTGRAAIRDAVVQQINEILAIYKTGIFITDVALQPAKAPEQVKEAFDDAIKAQEDEQRYINQAQAYAKEVVPVAQGRAKRIFEEAAAYRQQVELIAQAEIARYLALLPAYLQAPEVTRKRMYLKAMEDILSNTNKVLMDTKSNQNIVYLPFDKWFGPNSESAKASLPVTCSEDGSATLAANQANAAENRANHPGQNAAVRTSLRGVNNSLASGRPQRFAFVNHDNKIDGARAK